MRKTVLALLILAATTAYAGKSFDIVKEKLAPGGGFSMVIK